MYAKNHEARVMAENAEYYDQNRTKSMVNRLKVEDDVSIARMSELLTLGSNNMTPNAATAATAATAARLTSDFVRDEADDRYKQEGYKKVGSIAVEIM
tara:strand:+ start:636 stop:929 length:294 start_codon:yes stop_codon:yes gene_type:complete